MSIEMYGNMSFFYYFVMIEEKFLQGWLTSIKNCLSLSKKIPFFSSPNNFTNLINSNVLIIS